MNSGKIDSDTAARRVWLYLRARPGELISSWELAQETQTVAVSTRVAEVRRSSRRTSAYPRKSKQSNVDTNFFIA